ncbi:DUF58 domain-containing protein [Halomicroarcula sp. GCM10025709]|uniref:DUF58 domain-containing protein n=1 Tax=Halomicroarcula sp. GCM10025709 TaxID=3252669 RepID=UPI003620C9A0
MTGDTDLCCRPRLGSLDRPVPTRTHATRRGGLVETTESGAGTEFFGVREYERGDPLAWIDWNRLARTGEFATLQFREQRAVTVVFVVDATDSATVGPPDADETAAERCVAAAGRLVGTALDGGNHAGLAAVGAADCWLAPGAGRSHRVAARDFLARTPALAPGRHGDQPSDRWARTLRQRLPEDAQVVVLSPLCDDRIATGVRRLHADGYPVTVLSPDPTARRSDPERVAAVTRRLRLSDLRAGGVPVLDWEWDDSLDVALADRRARR